MQRFFFICCFISISYFSFSQRLYKTSSIISTGSWFKISIKEPGVYKVDAAFLTSLGINTVNLSSSSIRLLGNGGQMLPENCSGTVIDDLEENAIEINDGGDGIFNGADYFLFFATGPVSWLKDSINRRFNHQNNLFSNQSFYFITVGGTGKRVKPLDMAAPAPLKVTSFNDRYFHELDTINFLNSGKEWYGEQFGKAAGNVLTKTFTIPSSGINLSEPGTIVSDCISRSINSASLFRVTVNNSRALQHNMPGVSPGNQDIFAASSLASGAFVPSATLSVTYNFESTAEGAQGWLNWFELFSRKTISLAGAGQLLFRDWNSVGPGNSAEFTVQSATAGSKVWDITDPLIPLQMKTVAEGSSLKFINDCSRLHEYIAFNATTFLSPVAVGRIDNQDLHAAPTADLVIIAYPAMLPHARRLADYHISKHNMKVTTVTTTQVYNEFSSGSPDPTAIRDFIKMMYDRAGTDTSRRPKYLLLFGDASYDYKDRSTGNTNYVPAYESRNSLDPLASYTSDDYFGFLDDQEDINRTSGNLLDIGIGRIPAKTTAEAASYVDKVINYGAPASLGPWRNQLSFIADDEDFNLHFDDAEIITSTAAATNPVFDQHKIYLDAYPEESNSSGSRYPLVNQVLGNGIQNGTLIWNYNGHGGFRRLAEEVILDQAIVNSWNNPDKLPLFITATCDFAPYDNYGINSLGENILLRPKTGAIALMTTTRLVFAFSNRIMNRNYIAALLRQHPDGSYPSLGEATKKAKNITYQSGSDVINNLKFTLLGDPALNIAFPLHRIQTNTINGRPVSSAPDTMRALQKYTVEGTITDNLGNILKDFTGTLYSTIFEKSRQTVTLGNDPQSVRANFDSRENIIAKCKTEVKNGSFTVSFIVPKDIDYRFGQGKISYYAENGALDANGSFTNFIIGGSQGIIADMEGPQLKAVLNSENFVGGGSTGPDPVLLLKLNDSSGINILGTGIGHDITAIIDNDPRKLFKLNEFFEPGLNSYKSGTIKFTLPETGEGMHTLKIKAWDVVNNSSEISVPFNIIRNKSFSIYRVINFPNPFNTRTTFRFEHDLPAQDVEVQIAIFTHSGKLIKSLKRTINTAGKRSSDIEWDSKTDSGASILSGSYIYRLRVTSNTGSVVEKAGKMLVQ